MPRFATTQDQHYAQVLMQPALIRIIDNIRKQLDTCDWNGSYRDDMSWPPEATTEQKQQYLALQEMLETANPKDYDRIQATLAQLPIPEHTYILCLTKQEQQQEINLWQLCYRLIAEKEQELITVDTTLLDLEQGDINWIALDDKAKRLVEAEFQSL